MCVYMCISPVFDRGILIISLCMCVCVYVCIDVPCGGRCIPSVDRGVLFIISCVWGCGCVCVCVCVDRCGCVANVNFAKTGMGLLEIAIVFGEAVRIYVICMYECTYVWYYKHTQHTQTHPQP
jgi:hypothetical protein